MKRFDLNKSVEENFERYQDELDKHPELYAMLKVRYDHFLKSYTLHLKRLEVKEPKKQGCKVQQFEFLEK